MNGTITTVYSKIGKISAGIKDSGGKVYNASDTSNKKTYDIRKGTINRDLKFAKLKKGTATISFNVELINYYSNDGKTIKSNKNVVSHSWTFKVN